MKLRCPSCESKRVVESTLEGRTHYRCTKCRHEWELSSAFDFSKIEAEADGDDYHGKMLLEHVKRDEDMRKASMSGGWARRRTKATTPEKMVRDLLEIKAAVIGLLRIHGMPFDTKVSVAELGSVGHGLAGFEDLKNFKHPYIMLDKKVYDACEPRDVLDVYCGVGLHECSHILHTREFFKMMMAGTAKGQIKMWINLLEDERIEELVRVESPGYAPYLHAAKRVLFESKQFGSAVLKFDTLPDLDKVVTIFFGAVRTPYLITTEMREFTSIKGTRVWDELRKLLPEIPSTEREVLKYAEKMQELWKKIKAEYAADEATLEDIVKTLEKGDPDEIEDLIKAMGGAGEPDDDEEAIEIPGGKGKGDGKGKGKGDGKEEDSSPEGTPSEDAKDASEGEESEAEGKGDEEGDETKAKESASDCTDDEAKAPSATSVEKPPEPEDAKTEKTPEEVKAEAKKERRKELLKEISERLTEHMKAVTEDATVKKSIDRIEEKRKEIAAAIDRKGTREEIEKEGAAAEVKRLERSLALESYALERLVADRMGRRFSEMDLEKMMEAFEIVTKAMSTEESSEMASAVESEVEVDPETWSEGCGRSAIGTRRTVITHPKPHAGEKMRYDVVLDEVKEHVARMRSVFRLRLGERRYVDRELTEGRLDRRMLAKGTMTNRLFNRKRTTVAQGLALALVLDESGSMGSADVSRAPARVALQVAILIAESLRYVPKIELEVFSYSSCGDHEQDNYVKHLYGKRNKDIKSIAHYCHGAQNYDHVALRTCGRLFMDATTYTKRMMIVLSDGAPCGFAYGGEAAVRATKKEVDALEKKGINVMQVAIRNFESERMFKNFIRFTNLGELVNDMRHLITKLVKSATES